MKKKVKENILGILSVLAIVLCFSICAIKDIKMEQYNYQLDMSSYEKSCQENECIEEYKPVLYKMDSIGRMAYTIRSSGFRYITYFLILLITIPGTYQVYKELHSGYIKNIITRTTYKQYIKQKLVEALKKTIWIFPVAFLVCFGVSIIVSNGIIDINYTYQNSMPGISIPPEYYLRNFGLTSLGFLINLVLYTFIALNIGLINCKKSKNFILCIGMNVIVSFVLTILITVIIGIIIGETMLKIPNAGDYVSFHYLLAYGASENSNRYEMFFMTCSLLIMTVLSFLITYTSYKNKEKVLIELEK